MSRLIQKGRKTRYVLTAALCVGAFSLIGLARQVPSITEGVYSTRQAERAGLIYQAQCAGCHGDALQGAGAGPPLAGDSFLSNWSGRRLLDLVSKIEKTMPFDAPGSLSRQQSTDLMAYILQAGKFPSGQADLNEGVLTQVALPTVRTSPAPAASLSGTSLPPPQGTLAEFMRSIAFYNANIIFNLQLKNPSDEPKKQMPYRLIMSSGDTPFIPAGWLSIRPPLLSPKRRLCF